MRVLAYIHPKTAGKIVLCRVLEWQVRRLKKKHDFLIVTIAGSMGKTSTKLAVAQLLEMAGRRVQYQEGNYNDRLTVPLVLFGRSMPELFNVPAWLAILKSNEQAIRQPYPYDVAVLEIGTDGPGQIAKFDYLQPDLAIVTAIAPEHMEYFGTIEAVAKEEMASVRTARNILLNVDDIPAKYLPEHFNGYGMSADAEGYHAISSGEDLDGQYIAVHKDGRQIIAAQTRFLGIAGRKIVLAAVAAADILGLEKTAIGAGIQKLEPFAGRMQVLAGIKHSTLLDDTYNAAPAAVEAALGVLASAKTGQRIAVLGSMNELGNFEAEAHKAIGASIDPRQISLVVTIGRAAGDYLAPAAEANGCIVQAFLNPKKAGEFIRDQLQDGAVILFKGSQNGVFAEEAIKPLLKHESDSTKLVRQSAYWMKRKRSVLTS